MDIIFSTKSLEKICNSEKEIIKKYGAKIGGALKIRLFFLRRVYNLFDVPVTKPERRHKLSGNYVGCYGIDLSENYRLVIRPVEPFSLLPDGGHDLRTITSVVVLEVEDYH